MIDIKRHQRSGLGTALGTAMFTLALAACSSQSSGPAPTIALHPGASAALGAGTASSWVRTDATGMPIAMGVTLTDTSLQQLGDGMTMTVLPLPPISKLPFATAVINWNPHGHPPAHIYDVPHFDVHFYEVAEATRMAISPALPAASVVPNATLVPPGYTIDAGGVVPQMGLHYLPTYQPEFHGQPFTATPIYGYWNGHDAFVEGMVTTAYLATNPTMTQALHQPAAVDRPGYYPTAWHITPNASAQTLDVTFDGFVQR